VLLKTFGWSVGLTVAGLLVALWYDGVSAASITAILIVLEVSLSFDNAVVNAKVLGRLSDYWQGLFLTVGMVIAVFGMRLLFPLIVVGVSAHLSPWRAWSLALDRGNPDTPGTYGYILHDAHPAIAAFGGVFLLMIFLDFLIDPDKELHWIDPLERLFQRIGVIRYASVMIALLLLLVFGLVEDAHAKQVLIAGVVGLLSYLLVSGAAEKFEESADDDAEPGNVPLGAAVAATGKAAFVLFVYLQVLDASFSFDGVIGAFAITADPIVIALGLGIGAFYVRSLTIYLVRKGTLAELVYLEHGAHWAIGALAVLLFVSIGRDIPEVVTGLIGVAFIAASFWSSLRVRDSVAHAV